MRECQRCGFPADDGVRHCPKCDADLLAQTDGSIRTIDVAHGRETVADALAKLRSTIRRERTGLVRTLRVVVGQGLIRDAVAAELAALRARRAIAGWDFEKNNPGSVLVTLKR
ncbi:MAG: hypothetical protein ACRDGR_04565 [bacterium]